MDLQDRKDQILSELGSLVAKQEVGACSFCGQDAHSELPIVRSHLSGKAICSLCLLQTQLMMGLGPEGAIICAGCKRYNGLIVTYDTAKVSWRFAGLDSVGVAIYQPFETSGSWNMIASPKHSHCLNCSTKIPVANLSTNRYLMKFDVK